jgi:hypothetical protein
MRRPCARLLEAGLEDRKVCWRPKRAIDVFVPNRQIGAGWLMWLPEKGNTKIKR